MNEVIAEVVEVPKPERPELWVCLYADADGWAFEGPWATEELARHEAEQWAYAHPVRIPASTAASEPDWIMELLRLGYDPLISFDSRCVNCILWRGSTGELRGTGPDPQSAAKACVQRLRGAT